MKKYLFNGFTILLLLFLMITGICLYSVQKEEIHLGLNTWHNSALDHFFTYITHLGDGYFISLVVLISLFINCKKSLIILTCFVVTGGITQLFKKAIYYDALRPVKFFEGKADLYLVKGIEMNLYNSFPSGHATSAFALFFSLALMTEKLSLQILLFVLALAASFSRVYLSQHFLEDIFAGAFIGSFFSLILYSILNKYLPGKLNRPIHLLRN